MSEDRTALITAKLDKEIDNTACDISEFRERTMAARRRHSSSSHSQACTAADTISMGTCSGV